jgi:hypothetical protein
MTSPALPPDSSDVPEPIYNLAAIIFEARHKSSWGKWKVCQTPARQRYGHNPTAEFDMAIDCAKAVLKRYELREKTGVEAEAKPKRSRKKAAK